jgi:VanZ family protein
MAPLRRYGPPAALMAVIFGLSSISTLDSGLEGDFVLRKFGHMAEYGLLWFLWLRALRYRRPALAAAITIGYAATDEFHQSFVDGRHGTITDVGIDAAGVAVAWAAWALWTRRRRPPRARASRAPSP